MLKNFLSNTYTQASLALAAIGGLISDQIGKGYGVVIFIAVAIFIYAIYDEIKTKKLYTKENIAIPIVFNISNPADSKSSLEMLFEKLEDEYPNHKEHLKKYFNIIEKDLIFKYDGDIFNEERFIDFLKIAKHDIKKLEAQTPKNVHYHIAYIGPIANAIMVGTIFGTEGVTLYQYNKSTNSYNIALEINDRSYKEGVDSFKVIEQEKIGKIKESVTIAIDMASHKISLGKLQEPIIHLKSTLGDTIKTKEDFIRANQEIYSIINHLQQEKVKHIKLVYSMPVSIAFLLGMSIQTYWDIELLHFDNVTGEYKTVIKHLNKIRYYF